MRLFVELADAGRTRYYQPPRLRRLGFASRIDVTGPVDSHAPMFRSAGASTGHLDLRRRDGRLVVRMHATDIGSGIREATMALHRPGRIEDVEMRLVSGTRRDGVYRAVVPLDRCDAHGGRWSIRFYLTDRAGLSSHTGDYLHVQARNSDLVSPYVARVLRGSRTNSGPFRLRFSSPVAGVSPTSLVVRTGRTERYQPIDVPPAVAGTWRCRTTDGAPVDCQTGPVRVARWLPAVPLPPGTRYWLDLAPEHVALVTDLAGNPLEPYARVLFGTRRH